MLKQLFLTFFALFSLFTSLYADEVRPGYLQLKEKSSNSFSVILKVPARGDKKLSLQALLPKNCRNIVEKNSVFFARAYTERWSVRCEGGIVNKTIKIEGLQNTNTDLLLRLEFLNGTSQSVLLSSTKNSYKVPKLASSFQVIQTYTWLGITHILLGFDHLLFVFSLLLIVKNMHRLLWTITAFTFAHSITMVGATLGLIHMPQKPVEAIIALSILFLAIEIVHEKQGKAGLTSRFPWLIAFIFGLLHGFGFAGALAEIGLPQQAVTLALIFFNIGVELGQLFFVGIVVIFTLIITKLEYPILLQMTKTLIVYGIGGISTFWLIERIISF